MHPQGDEQDGHLTAWTLPQRADIRALGLSDELVDRFFTGTVTRVAACRWKTWSARFCAIIKKCWNLRSTSCPRRQIPYKKDGEHHLYNTQTIHLLQTAVRTGDYSLFKEYIKHMEGEAPVALRNLLGFTKCQPIRLRKSSGGKDRPPL